MKLIGIGIMLIFIAMAIKELSIIQILFCAGMGTFTILLYKLLFRRGQSLSFLPHEKNSSYNGRVVYKSISVGNATALLFVFNFIFQKEDFS